MTTAKPLLDNQIWMYTIEWNRVEPVQKVQTHVIMDQRLDHYDHFESFCPLEGLLVYTFVFFLF